MSSPSSSSLFLQDGPDHPTITRRATIGDPVYDNQVLSRQRRKATIVACERCRRRKIRCDGNQPCQTCARFGVRCAKPEERRERSGSNAEHAALADRVRQLEARLAAVASGDANFLPSGGNDGMEQPGPPSLSLDTTFDLETSPQAISLSAGPYDEISLHDDFLSPNVPTIQITGPHGSIPSSPLMHSPSPSLFSGTSRASSPDPFSAVSFDFASVGTGSSMLPPGSGGAQIRTPPLGGQWADVYRHDSLQPESPGGQGWISRPSSISSFGGLGEGFCGLHVEQTLPAQSNGDWNTPNWFETTYPERNDQALPDPTPTKAQAGALADHAFTIPLPIDKIAFKVCFEAVYSLPSVSSEATPDVSQMLARYTSYSLRVARCLVFLVLTIGMRMSNDSGRENLGLESCYAVALLQMKGVGVWAENGAGLIAGLLGKLAEVSRGSG